jgi:uncharacterized protein
MTADVFDPLYGAVSFEPPLGDLCWTPLVQRLRQVRLSNIDSIDLPGIAGISRYEHSLGAAHLARSVGFFSSLSREQRLALAGSALLHDWAITAFGHLFEEALQYAGAGFMHEARPLEVWTAGVPDEIGGVERQIIAGRESGVLEWARRAMRSADKAIELVQSIVEQITGGGLLGGVIAADIDVDNIDSVFRLARHMGIPTDVEAPMRLAKAMVSVDNTTRRVVFRRSAESDINLWLKTRRNVYNRLMLSRNDFAGKVMLLFASIMAVEAGELGSADWVLTDAEYLTHLLCAKNPDSKEATGRWLAGELWSLTPLRWLRGARPDYENVRAFSKRLSEQLGRTCLAYGIRDKRGRRLEIQYENGGTKIVGSTPAQWLLGVGSPARRRFGVSDIDVVFDSAREYFNAPVVTDLAASEQSEEEPWLF